MIRATHHWIEDETGSSVIEAAATLPVFLLLMFGFINFMMYTMDVCNMTYATRAALRYACLHGATSGRPATIADMYGIVHPLDYKYPPNAGTIQISYPAAGGDCTSPPGGADLPGQTVMVCVTLDVHMSVMGYNPSGFNIVTSSQGIVIH